jgi:spore maturation protein CgeB
MKMMVLDWNFYGKEPTFRALNKLGIEVCLFSHKDFQERVSAAFTSSFKKFISDNRPDICFSYNFYPLLSESCHELNIPYISFIYDSPYVLLYSTALRYETNHVFLFDSAECRKFNLGGFKNVHYMVLPGDPDYMNELSEQNYSSDRDSCDISFVGVLYNEEHNFYERYVDKSDKLLVGYLDGIMDAQHLVYGTDLIEKSFDSDIMDKIGKTMQYKFNSEGIETPEYIYSRYLVDRKMTSRERFSYLEAVGRAFPGKARLFTVDKNVKIHNIKNMGIALYPNVMASVFSHSKINLNITLRSITNGIPLRCIDIMSSGGFLLSNYQEDLAEAFSAGEEFDYFDSEDSLVEKIHYWLNHDKERREAAEAAKEHIRRDYNFPDTFRKMIDIAVNE